MTRDPSRCPHCNLPQSAHRAPCARWHGDERGHRVDTAWTESEGRVLGTVAKVPLGHGMSVSVCEKWCARCRRWVECVGPMGALTFQLEHEHGEGMRA